MLFRFESPSMSDISEPIQTKVEMLHALSEKINLIVLDFMKTRNILIFQYSVDWKQA